MGGGGRVGSPPKLITVRVSANRAGHRPTWLPPLRCLNAVSDNRTGQPPALGQFSMRARLEPTMKRPSLPRALRTPHNAHRFLSLSLALAPSFFLSHRRRPAQFRAPPRPVPPPSPPCTALTQRQPKRATQHNKVFAGRQQFESSVELGGAHGAWRLLNPAPAELHATGSSGWRKRVATSGQESPRRVAAVAHAIE